jgi:tRNA uridine 5-carboxymethylaminomethyl modification enzyme
VAGINAARQSLEMQLITLSPKDSMIGVLIDDIVSLGVTEPYRMIPTRSNYKFTQRYDNADERLTPLGISLGLVK